MPTFSCLSLLVSRGFDGFMSKSHAMAKNSGTLHCHGCPCRTLKPWKGWRFSTGGNRRYRGNRCFGTLPKCTAWSKIGWNSNMLSHYLSTMAFRFRILGIILPGSLVETQNERIVFLCHHVFKGASCYTPGGVYFH